MRGNVWDGSNRPRWLKNDGVLDDTIGCCEHGELSLLTHRTGSMSDFLLSLSCGGISPQVNMSFQSKVPMLMPWLVTCVYFNVSLSMTSMMGKATAVGSSAIRCSRGSSHPVCDGGDEKESARTRS